MWKNRLESVKKNSSIVSHYHNELRKFHQNRSTIKRIVYATSLLAWRSECLDSRSIQNVSWNKHLAKALLLVPGKETSVMDFGNTLKEQKIKSGKQLGKAVQRSAKKSENSKNDNLITAYNYVHPIITLAHAPDKTLHNTTSRKMIHVRFGKKSMMSYLGVEYLMQLSNCPGNLNVVSAASTGARGFNLTGIDYIIVNLSDPKLNLMQILGRLNRGSENPVHKSLFLHQISCGMLLYWGVT